MPDKVHYHDEYHRVVREYYRLRSLAYGREIAAIMKNHNCSCKEAQLIRRKRKLEEELKKLNKQKSEEK